MKTAALASLALLLAAPAAIAAPLKHDQVPADAKWLVHLDVDAMLDSAVVQKGLDKWMKDENGEKHLAKAKREIGMDLREDLHALTLFNSSYAEHQGVLIISADFDRQKIAEKAKHAKEHKVESYKDYELHTWRDDKHGEGSRSAGAFVDDHTLVIGSSAKLVKNALDVLAGDKPGLSQDGDSALTGAVSDGTIMLARVIGLASAELPNKKEIPKGVDQLSLAIGESDGESFIVGRAGTKDADTAKNVAQALEGLRAMALLSGDADADAKSIIKEAAIERSDSAVEFEMKAPAEKLWQVMKNAEAHKKRVEARRERREARRNGDKAQKQEIRAEGEEVEVEIEIEVKSSDD